MMLVPRLLMVLVSLFVLESASIAKTHANTTTWTFQVDGVERTANVVIPSKIASDKSSSKSSPPIPVVFVFHGHGGTAKNAQNTFAMEKHWPEAICIYPQGLPTPGRLTDREGKRNGWQHSVGHMGDRDLNFVDAMMERLRKEYVIAPSQVFAAGHSNGAGFCYLLWEVKADLFAAFGPSAAAALQTAKKFKPKPGFIIAGTKDPLVQYSWQKSTIQTLLGVNQCNDSSFRETMGEVIYESKLGATLAVFLHDGGHELSRDGVKAMSQFFQRIAAESKQVDAPEK